MTTEASFFGLAGKKAMVIGGGQGMGESTSRFLARAGCDVAVIDVERDRAERVAGVVEEVGCRGVPIVGDVLDDAQIPTIVAAAEQQFGHVDVMVSIVGAAAWGPLLDTTAEIWDQQLHLNMRYFFLCAREVAATMITEQFLTIEAKYQNAVQMPNFVHLMMASNEDWVVPAALDARRFFVLEVSAVRAKDHAYFGDIWSELDNGGYQAMLHDLLKHDLTFYNPRRVPVTEGLQTQRKLSLPAAEDWWAETLLRGYVYKSRLGLDEYFGLWHEQMATEVLFDAYSAHAKARNERHPMGREPFGKFMVSMGAKSTKPRNAVIGEGIVDVPNAYGGTSRKAELIRAERSHGFKFGTLSSARAGFEKATGLQMVWPSDDEEAS